MLKAQYFCVKFVHGSDNMAQYVKRQASSKKIADSLPAPVKKVVKKGRLKSCPKNMIIHIQLSLLLEN